MGHDPAESLHELHEQAEQGQHYPQLIPVSVTMSVLAVIVAVVTLMGHRLHTEEVVTQIKASDTWAEYQAKNIRHHSYATFSDFIAVIQSKDAEKAAKLQESFGQQSERYDREKDQLQEKARELENEATLYRRKANRFDFGEVLVQVSLIITSITLLTRRRPFWYLGIVVGVFGIIVASTGYLVH
jgi:predicted ribosome quality control (RQC) complex YloA/Tae2 family protein